ncbi:MULTISPECIES: glutathione S-transferase family protein [unclassified Coleofasciculus]|uniref:glutathione S-transferase family protein n=1 Tax=unclassified Coleofasciculus TaxID=2692782 RepID=UPI0018826DFC|nr:MULTISPECIES: glutathione S-transferase family protein [unclassified Coleofasciculus]MBE9128175.1 glutathione S-transferase family protein [Coleofasciculus sp. LEGE 07081]MBE9149724.1 glutathione S-transferase family protein [Coleofasciculus sp. LEGE 07092]
MNRILYYHQQSNFSRKIRILLAEKNLECELREINLVNKPPEFIQLSPIGKVPVFVDEDGTVIWDSTLIAEYLDETYPQMRFYPCEPRRRLECRKWEELADHLGDNIINLWILNLKKIEDSRYRQRLETSINRLLEIFEQQLAKSKYLLGDETWTAADVAALCSLGYYSLRLDEDWLLKYIHLRDWFNKLHERSSVKSTVPEKA